MSTFEKALFPQLLQVPADGGRGDVYVPRKLINRHGTIIVEPLEYDR
jgi:hypothetical protein